MIKEVEIIADLVEKLSDIRTTNEYAEGKNYATDIGAEVNDWNDKPVESGDTDEVIVSDEDIEELNDDGKRYLQTHRFRMQISIRIFMAQGNETISMLRKAEADVYRCIGKYNRFFLDKYRDFAFKPGARRRQLQEGSRTFGGSYVLIYAEYSTPAFYPDLD